MLFIKNKRIVLGLGAPALVFLLVINFHLFNDVTNNSSSPASQSANAQTSDIHELSVNVKEIKKKLDYLIFMQPNHSRKERKVDIDKDEEIKEEKIEDDEIRDDVELLNAEQQATIKTNNQKQMTSSFSKPHTILRCRKEYIEKSRYVFADGVRANCNIRHRLVIIVSSYVDNEYRRNTIRNTWANKTKWEFPNQDSSSWTVVFNVGYEPGKTNKGQKFVQLRNELLTHGDMIVSNVTESFYTLSLKLAIGMDWLYRTLHFDFVLKTDDDVFVNLRNIMPALEALPNHIEYFGHVMWRQPVERTGRYKLSSEEFKNDRFDPYCSGAAIFARFNLIQKINVNLKLDKPLLKYEDAYFGSLAYQVGVVPSRIHKQHFDNRNVKCKYIDHLFTSHPAKTRKCMEKLMSKAAAPQRKQSIAR